MGEKVSACLQFDIAIEEFWKFCAIFTIGKGMLLFFSAYVLLFCFFSTDQLFSLSSLQNKLYFNFDCLKLLRFSHNNAGIPKYFMSVVFNEATYAHTLTNSLIAMFV